MPRPRDPHRRRLASAKFRDGYAVVIGDIWYLRHGVSKKSTGLRDAGNDRRVVRLLDEWLERRLYPTPVAPLEAAADRSVYGLYIDFVAARGLRDRPLVRTYDAMLRHVFPTDLPLTYDVILAHLTRRKGELLGPIIVKKKLRPLAATSRAQYMKCAGALLRFAVERGELPRNPMDAVGVPAAPLRDENPTYSDGELRVIIQHLSARDGLMVSLMAITAMRSIEVLRLRPDDITPSSLRIEGKGSGNRPIRVRHIPMNPLGLDPTSPPTTDLEQWYHDLWAVLAALLRLSPTETGLLFPGPYSSILRRFTLAQGAAGLDGGERRRLHTLRATAEERWERIGFDPMTISDQAGHSLPVYLSRYRARRTVDRTSERIRATARRQLGE